MIYDMSLLISQLLSHLHVFIGSKSLYNLGDDKLLEWGAVEQLQLTTPAHPLVFLSLSHEVVQPLRKERPAVKRAWKIGLDDKESPVRPPATFSDAGLFLEDH